MGPGLMARLGVLSSTSDHASVVNINLFVALLCACIVLGHLLEENRWVNESMTALIIVSEPNTPPPCFIKKKALLDSQRTCSARPERVLTPRRLPVTWQGLCTGVVILLTTKGKSSHILVFSEDLFFIYLLPPIIFNAG
jgi:hypothetical protein